MKNLSKYISGKLAYNYHNWPEPNIIEQMEEYNEILKFVYTHIGKEPIALTQHGHLPKTVFGNFYAITKTASTNTFEFIMVYGGFLYRFVFWPGRKLKEVAVSGRQALNKFRKEAGDLAAEFAVTDNETVKEIKKLIPSPKIALAPFTQQVINLVGAQDCIFTSDESHKVFHLDLNSAYPAGIVSTTPQLKSYFTALFERRHDDPDAKMLLNAGIGAMQSLKLSGRRYPELSRRALTWTNEELDRKTKELEDKGCIILSYNTDGIWAMCDGDIPQLSNMGNQLGQWKIDHVVEKLRFKSRGAYEFIENGKYHPVIRGATRLDQIKSRDEWKWGDIFQENAKIVMYTFDENNFIKEVEVSDEEINFK